MVAALNGGALCSLIPFSAASATAGVVMAPRLLLSTSLSFDWVSVFNNLNCLLFAIILQTVGSMRNGLSINLKDGAGHGPPDCMGICNNAAAFGATFMGMSHDGKWTVVFVLTFSLTAVNA